MRTKCSACGKPVSEFYSSNGYRIVVHTEDRDSVYKFNWRAFKPDAGRTRYAATTQTVNKKPVTFLMHRFIVYGWDWFGKPELDHKNRNGLDNRRCNLRPATRSQNGANTVKRDNCSSKYKGVSKNYTRVGNKNVYDGRWYASIQDASRGCLRRIGTFLDEKEAARAYDIEALKMWGEFAVPNLPGSTLVPKKHVFKLRRDSTTGFRGVSKDRGTIIAYINHGGKRVWRESFPDFVSAATAYDIKAIEYHGDRAITNFRTVKEERY